MKRKSIRKGITGGMCRYGFGEPIAFSRHQNANLRPFRAYWLIQKARNVSFRKALLQEHYKIGKSTKLIEHYDDGLTLFEVCKTHKFEGIVAKLAASTYKHGQRSADWLKIKYSLIDQFTIVGYRDEDGYLVSHNGRIAGYVLYGFSKADHKYLGTELEIESEEMVKKKKSLRFKPTVKIEIEFMEWTSKKLLRAPVFKRFVQQ